MKMILAQDQHAMGLHESMDSEITKVRLAARGVIKDDKGHVAVMYFTTSGSYKLPGGGIDDGEAVIDALRREVREETGYLIDTIKELGLVEEDRYFCGIHQTSYCFTARATEFVGTELTSEEQAEGMELRWAASIDQAIEWVLSNHATLKDETQAGLQMMIAREVAILQAAKGSPNPDE